MSLPLAHYQWPFYEAEDLALAQRLDAWAHEALPPEPGPAGADAAHCRAVVQALGRGGWLAPFAHKPRMRTLCILREVLARHGDIADFCLAMQGLGCFALSVAGTPWQREHFLLPATRGERITGFALSEPDAGSDLGGVRLSARPAGDDYLLEGTKAWISNAGAADHYLVIARTAGESGALGLSCFIVPADTPGLHVEQTELLCPRPFGYLHFRQCRIARRLLVGEEGQGGKLAMDTLAFYRPSVGAAALGLARRAMHEALAWVQERRVGERPLSDYQLTQHQLAGMAAELDAATLLVARAAWLADSGADFAAEGSMAKWQATERAQQLIDTAVQLLGARGVLAQSAAGRAYREIRSLRIYEGTSEIQQLIVAQRVLRTHRAGARMPPPGAVSAA